MMAVFANYASRVAIFAEGKLYLCSPAEFLYALLLNRR
ncbi:MAG: hypothetical protein JWO91_2364 [Acidobacteriaceae bacterium]|jgi:hypothetical protein|nr:hypothetical protein [Acidobacteriaceae bacterium]